MARKNFNRTQDEIDLDNWIQEREAGNIRKCEACHTEKFLSEQRQCPETYNWYCIQCIHDGTMEHSISKWFNESIEEFNALVSKLKLGRTGVDNKRINYIK